MALWADEILTFDELASVTTATRKFKITFLPMNVTVEVDPDKLPLGDTGLPGSILDVALSSGIDIDHACGGVCACSTCHSVVPGRRRHPLGR